VPVPTSPEAAFEAATVADPPRRWLSLDPGTTRRLRKFRRLRRGWYSLIVLGVAYALSLGAELVVGNRPLFVSYQGSRFYPAITGRYYPQTLFGGTSDLETDFRELARGEAFRQAGGRVLLPPHPYSPLESIRIKGDPPPSYPSRAHPFGTDDRGRDVLARVVYGFRTSISFALLVTLTAYALGVLLGAIQGFWGGKIDLAGQRIGEIWSTLPFLYVVILVSSIIKPGFWTLVVILVAFDWLGPSRYVRAEVLRERQRDYVTAARALGASSMRILVRHVLGNAMTSALTLFPFALVGAIFSLTSLDFLGFGLPAPTPSWGELFQQGRSNISSWWLTVFPFLALATTLTLTTFVGEAMREAWDPREHHRRED
jgi:microcin C transport system permease protein